ncbi:hypothetical protein PoB_000262600 [Plakobranchus ocellatus]|uniref:Uncharacterized protein n=1 Tax=Plakobranchus ocellatus TaxID=259542 RepID=A0AAV3Y199_9GAST|nr:hypothetical protein PoB_000262600 [Plakobranchus ocellatus]
MPAPTPGLTRAHAGTDSRSDKAHAGTDSRSDKGPCRHQLPPIPNKVISGFQVYRKTWAYQRARSEIRNRKVAANLRSVHQRACHQIHPFSGMYLPLSGQNSSDGIRTSILFLKFHEDFKASNANSLHLCFNYRISVCPKGDIDIFLHWNLFYVP